MSARMSIIGLEALKLARQQGDTEQALREEIEILRRLLHTVAMSGWSCDSSRYLRILDSVVER